MANCAPNEYKGMKNVPPVQGGVPEELGGETEKKNPAPPGRNGGEIWSSLPIHCFEQPSNLGSKGENEIYLLFWR